MTSHRLIYLDMQEYTKLPAKMKLKRAERFGTIIKSTVSKTGRSRKLSMSIIRKYLLPEDVELLTEDELESLDRLNIYTE